MRKARARPCSLAASTAVAVARSVRSGSVVKSSGLSGAAEPPAAPAATIRGWPSVSVPVLSKMTVPAVASRSIAAALRAGALDAIQVFQPYAEDLLASGAGHVWYAAADRGLTAYTTLVTRRSLLVERRDELAAMVRAVHQALRWIARQAEPIL